MNSLIKLTYKIEYKNKLNKLNKVNKVNKLNKINKLKFSKVISSRLFKISNSIKHDQ